ncbi:Glutathione synthetase large chain [Sparassis crispa]|uniref:Glutathione synthetase n=1 Tax=Sparassis crispa TaxID=139825 RepID=A0A401GTB1_9APHY|nr:Glutathione synthetase large chain [Sparassis crispa]GBE85446.1 Glutathione synthetase large chain [Sparassis crispa]
MEKSAVVDWPPAISDSQLEALTLLATTYALSHGLVYLPAGNVQPPAPTSVIHAPIALFPSPIPRHLFLLAQTLQRTYNVLYARVATDEKFLDRVMGEVEGVGKVDEFTGQLWRRWRKLRDEGIVQPVQLGLFRSDYLLHAPDGADPSLKQVEFNTISSSFGGLSQQTAGLHKYLYKSTEYYKSSPHLKKENFPPNNTIAGLAEGLAEAHKAYNVANTRILFVVQDGERNVFDQRWLEYELLEKHSIHVIRQSFNQLLHSAKVDPETRALRVMPPNSLLSDGSESVEISTVYLRAGYTPIDYPTSAHYDLRYLFESSRAIQCPSIQLQLAGGKKVQEVLTKPGVLESFLMNEARWGTGVVPREEVDRLRASWMGMWGLDEEIDSDGTTHEGLGVLRARELSASLVLKPQREGGGNNVYKEAIQPFLDSLPPQEREAWIAMRLIAVPEGLGNYLVRAGGGTDGAVKTEVVSELGIFGWALFGGADGGVKEKEVGWLLRTKGKDSNEGGVAAGFSVLDSVVLVD